MTLFPFFENIDGKTFVIIGAGNVAERKAEKLLPFTKNIIVIGENADIDGVKNINRNFEKSDIFLGDYVIAATDDEKLNSLVSSLCKENGIPVNSVDKPEDCSFIFPSLIKKGDLTVAITSGGKSPAFCKEIRKRTESILPENTEEILDIMGKLRHSLKKSVPDQKVRAKILAVVLEKLLCEEELTQEKTEKIITESMK